MKVKFEAGRLLRVYEIIPTVVIVNHPYSGIAVELHLMGFGVGIALIKKSNNIH